MDSSVYNVQWSHFALIMTFPLSASKRAAKIGRRRISEMRKPSNRVFNTDWRGDKFDATDKNKN